MVDLRVPRMYNDLPKSLAIIADNEGSAVYARKAVYVRASLILRQEAELAREELRPHGL